MTDPIASGSARRATDVHDEAESTPVAPSQARVTQLDQSKQSEWVHDEVRDAAFGPAIMLSDEALQRAVSDLSTLSGDALTAMLARLDKEHVLDKLFEAMNPEQREALFAMLEQKGLIIAHETSWKAGAWGIRPPALLAASSDAALPPSIEYALDERNARVNRDYVANCAAFAQHARSPVLEQEKTTKVDSPVAQPALARTPEEAARFEIGVMPTMSELLKDPVSAVAEAARHVSRQGDFVTVMRSLEVGDSTELKLGEMVSAKAKVERKGDQKYEITVSLEALAGLSEKAGVNLLELVNFDVTLGYKAGVTGAVKLAVSSPQELQQFLVALRTRAALDGVPKDRARLAAFSGAGDFIRAHVVGGRFGVKQEGSVGLSAATRLGSVSADAKLASQVELEVAKTDDGRRAVTTRRQLETKAGGEAGLKFLAKRGEALTRLIVEQTHCEPAKPGELDAVRIKVELEDTHGERIDARTLSFTIAPGELDAWLSAIRRSDKQALQTLMKGAKREETAKTIYARKVSAGVFSATAKRVMQETKR